MSASLKFTTKLQEMESDMDFLMMSALADTMGTMKQHGYSPPMAPTQPMIGPLYSAPIRIPQPILRNPQSAPNSNRSANALLYQSPPIGRELNRSQSVTQRQSPHNIVRPPSLMRGARGSKSSNSQHSQHSLVRMASHETLPDKKRFVVDHKKIAVNSYLISFVIFIAKVL